MNNSRLHRDVQNAQNILANEIDSLIEEIESLESDKLNFRIATLQNDIEVLEEKNDLYSSLIDGLSLENVSLKDEILKNQE